MTSFVLVPGAGGQGWVFHPTVAELHRRGHHAVAIDLPADDDSAGLDHYVEVIEAACSDLDGVVLVAQTMAGLSVPIAATRTPTTYIVLLNAMIPAPGESGGAWWAATGAPQARAALAVRQGRTITDDPDPLTDFFHDVPEAIVAEAMSRGEPRQSGRPFGDHWPLEAWPDIPTTVLVGRDDRFFPAEFQERVAQERLGLPVTLLPGGHLLALSQPTALADALGRAMRQPDHEDL